MDVSSWKMDRAMFVFTVAKQILSKIPAAEGDDFASINMGAYQNGREQGLSLSAHSAKGFRFVCWSENRNSDQIVIYRSSDRDPMQSISDDMYSNAEYIGGEVGVAEVAAGRRVASILSEVL